MAWRGPISRSLLAAARSPASVPRFRSPLPPAGAGPRLQRRRPSFSSPRYLGEIGCAHSLLPVCCVVAVPRLTSHLSVSARACCELSQGT